MHSHDHADEIGPVRPGSTRRTSDESGASPGAARPGRPDVLGSEGLLRLQRAIGNAGVSELVEQERSPVLDVIGSGGGSALDEGVRTDMEARLGHDFSDVRVHTDGAASDSAAAVNAHAYTVGSNVVFQRDRYDPASQAGRTMLAHELTHVVQQRGGPVDGTPTGDGVRVSDPSDRFEQEAAANAERVMSGPAPVQREAEEEELQGAFVQREAEEEELQGAFVQREAEEEELQGAFVQREAEEEELQGAFVQREAEEDALDA
ncbi:eCIS core domain-containing protein [Occultella gossypii]|uniref:DUF4157 domain-containing protein n=1 Tax=Occultella gossypii TaxID=2800820 RepID=A0ABS7S9L7_9MICO|nr:DUF4157 domain-containing protein [Occultella gossypii]MBZ2197041.1 DUF4157 domain-containing protein [Occultella gossypii]